MLFLDLILGLDVILGVDLVEEGVVNIISNFCLDIFS